MYYHYSYYSFKVIDTVLVDGTGAFLTFTHLYTPFVGPVPNCLTLYQILITAHSRVNKAFDFYSIWGPNFFSFLSS